MSCCTIKKETTSNKYLEILKSNFEAVSLLMVLVLGMTSAKKAIS